jgi:uncharacterized protein YciI
MTYLMLYNAVEDYMTRRTRFRAEHLRLANEAVERGELLLAGALGEQGSAFWFTSEEAAQQFAQIDPYMSGGLILSYQILPWNTAVGDKMFLDL